jgi:hypothetical protein
LRWLRQNLMLRWTPSQNRNFRMHLKMAEMLGNVHTHGRGLLRGWWWPVDQSQFWQEVRISLRNYGWLVTYILYESSLRSTKIIRNCIILQKH